MGKSVSVIINTYNRGFHLKRLIDALALQTYDNFEIVIVDGPSTDNTEEIRKKYQNFVKWQKCPEVNLCLSRNIGLNAASGEIVAYIDDDAVPCDKYWIENAVKYFEDNSIAAVGGGVKRINEDVEFANGTISIFGENTTVSPVSGSYNNPKGEVFNRTAGGNSFFRKSVLMEIGGFDEYYTYFLDETDLCIRIIQSGYKIIHVSNSAIYHEAAKGVNRKSKYHLNWNVISRSMGYFIMKSTQSYRYTEEERKERALESTKQWMDDFKFMLKNKYITRSDYKCFIEQVENGIKQGISDGIELERKLDYGIKNNRDDFLQFNKECVKESMNICMLCDADIFTSPGGIPVYTKILAQKYVELGHNVHVIISGDKCTLSNIDGVNIYKIKTEKIDYIDEIQDCPNCERVLSFSFECYKMIQKLKKVFNIQIVETPIWDVHGVVSSYLERDIPIVTRLQTPLKMVVNTFQMSENTDLCLLQRLEKQMIEHSDAIITISDCIKETVQKLYEIEYKKKVYKNYLGIDIITERNKVSNHNNLRVLFLGRMERRKGIDNIFDVIPRIFEKHNNVEFRFAGDCSIVDGVINDTYKHYFQTKYRKSSWKDNVIFLGEISETEKEKEFAECDIFISPSLYESFGIIFIEAMKYSKPVIGCNIGGMPEIIKDGVNGLLAEPGDSNSLYVALDKLLTDPELRNKMGNEGYRRVKEVFNAEHMAVESIDIYKDVINNFKTR